MLAFLFPLLAPPQFNIQTYTQALTPPELLPLGGYTERGDHIADPGGQELFARTLIISLGTQKVAFVSFEGLTVPESLHYEVQRRLPNTPVFLVATHTHSAPDTQMLNERMKFRIPGIAPFKREWLDWYALRIAGGIAKAEQSKPIPTNLNISNWGTNLARSRRPKSSVSNILYVIHGQNDQPLLTIFGAHATCLDADNRKTNGDWPGEYMRRTNALVFPGAIGNASPNFDQAQGQPKAEGVATALLKYVSGGSKISENLAFATEPIKLDPPKPHPEFAKQNGVNEALATIAVSRFAPPEAKITVALVGRVAIVGIPGEPTNDIERIIRARAEQAGFQGVVVSHCNGWIGYILSPEDYDRGGYEATLSFNGRETGLRVIEAATRLFKKLSKSATNAYSVQK
ncbi:hypothetical protein CCB80_13965 [Armatimonadetes bacterium Uphvl-Ar1]|nr:hypothetical protein CCB80_13965 [Armatimonadetes bacterium Uphvl-Ar1]